MLNFKNEIQLFNELKRLYRKILNTENINEDFLYSICGLILENDKFISKSKRLRILDKEFKSECKKLNLNYSDTKSLNLFKSKCIDFLNSNSNSNSNLKLKNRYV